MKRFLFLLLFSSITTCFSLPIEDEITVYNSQDTKTAEHAVGYSKMVENSSRYLVYRDIPAFIDQYAHGKKSLDYGSGIGFSAQFLQEQGLDVEGVDLSQEMLNLAIHNYPNIPFTLIENGLIPVSPETYDLVFSCFVLFELGSEEEIINYLREAKRVMKEDGVLIVATSSQDAYTLKDWYICNTDYPENQDLKSGSLVKAYVYDVGIEFTDYHWTEEDYRHDFEQAGLQLVEIHYPLGKETEPYPWKEEKTTAPFVIFVAKKITSD